MYYIRLKVICSPDWSEILMAEIADAGFDTFMETERGFEAYAEEGKADNDRVNAILDKYAAPASAAFFFDRVKKENWNEQWEKNYQPVVIDDQCMVRAHFHKPDKLYPYEIVITPRMSFGTGHHATTWLMIKNQLRINHTNMRVMDAGTGTGILAIMAEKRGAAFVDAFDTDEWSLENSSENIIINHCRNIRIRKGTVQTLTFEAPFSLVLANINKNVLLEEMPLYAQHLNSGGHLLLSGFWTTDVADLTAAAANCGLLTEYTDERENWAAMLLVKP